MSEDPLMAALNFSGLSPLNMESFITPPLISLDEGEPIVKEEVVNNKIATDNNINSYNYLPKSVDLMPRSSSVSFGNPIVTTNFNNMLPATNLPYRVVKLKNPKSPTPPGTDLTTSIPIKRVYSQAFSTVKKPSERPEEMGLYGGTLKSVFLKNWRASTFVVQVLKVNSSGDHPQINVSDGVDICGRVIILGAINLSTLPIIRVTNWNVDNYPQAYLQILNFTVMDNKQNPVIGRLTLMPDLFFSSLPQNSQIMPRNSPRSAAIVKTNLPLKFPAKKTHLPLNPTNGIIMPLSPQSVKTHLPFSPPPVRANVPLPYTKLSPNLPSVNTNLTLSSPNMRNSPNVKTSAVKTSLPSIPKNPVNTPPGTGLTFGLELNFLNVPLNILSRETKTWSDIIARYSDVEPTTGLWKCKFCHHGNKGFTWLKPVLVNHIQEVHLEKFPGYRCPDCPTSNTSLAMFARHKLVHKEGKTIKCMVRNCLKVFSKQEDFSKHLNEFHTINPKVNLDEQKTFEPDSKEDNVLECVDGAFTGNANDIKGDRNSPLQTKPNDQVKKLWSFDMPGIKDKTKDYSFAYAGIGSGNQKTVDKLKDETIDILKSFSSTNKVFSVQKSSVILKEAKQEDKFKNILKNDKNVYNALRKKEVVAVSQTNITNLAANILGSMDTFFLESKEERDLEENVEDMSSVKRLKFKEHKDIDTAKIKNEQSDEEAEVIKYECVEEVNPLNNKVILESVDKRKSVVNELKYEVDDSMMQLQVSNNNETGSFTDLLKNSKVAPIAKLTQKPKPSIVKPKTTLLNKSLLSVTNWEELADQKIMRAGVLYHCSDCPFRQKREEFIIDHIQTKHLPQFPGYQCPQCPDRKPSLVNFLLHMKTIHQVAVPEGERFFNVYDKKSSDQQLPKFRVVPASYKSWSNPKVPPKIRNL